jgi:hypothetical protein
MAVEALTIVEGTIGRNNLVVRLEELCCRVLLEELLPLDLKEVAVAHFLIGASMLLLDRSCLMGLHDIPLTSLDAFLEELLSLLGPFLTLVVQGAHFSMLILEPLKVLLQPIYVLHEVY